MSSKLNFKLPFGSTSEKYFPSFDTHHSLGPLCFKQYPSMSHTGKKERRKERQRQRDRDTERGRKRETERGRQRDKGGRERERERTLARKLYFASTVA